MLTAISLNNCARWTISEDGGVLLNLRTGKIFKIDPVGALIWNILTQYNEGIDSDYLIDRLHQTFTDVPRERIVSDVKLFLNRLAGLGLILNITQSSYPNREQVNELPLGDITAIEPERKNPVGTDMSSAPKSSLHPSLILTLLAILGLVGCDVAIKIGGFRVVHFLLVRFPRWRGRTVRAWTVDRICMSIDLACSLYLKRTLCLQRSFVGTFLLRLCGLPAITVIGARILPFHSHAWIEVEGKVVYDRQSVQTVYSVLERC